MDVNIQNKLVKHFGSQQIAEFFMQWLETEGYTIVLNAHEGDEEDMPLAQGAIAALSSAVVYPFGLYKRKGV